MRSINRIAKQFIKRELYGQVTYRTLRDYLIRRGFAINTYIPGELNDILEKNNLWEYAQKKQYGGFAFTSKNGNYVFLKSTLSDEERLTTLLHETAHIALGHLEKDYEKQTETKDRIQEMEAEAFAYAIIINSKYNDFWRNKLKTDPYRYIKREWRLKAEALIKECCING